MNHIQRKNAATFKRCQTNYDAMQPLDYYEEDPPPCHVCGYDSDQDHNDMPICIECLAKCLADEQEIEGES